VSNKNFKPSVEKSPDRKDLYVVKVGNDVKAIINKEGTPKYPWRWTLVFVPSPIQTGTSLTRNDALDNVTQILRGELA
jgi:hypothetical protein